MQKDDKWSGIEPLLHCRDTAAVHWILLLHGCLLIAVVTAHVVRLTMKGCAMKELQL